MRPYRTRVGGSGKIVSGSFYLAVVCMFGSSRTLGFCPPTGLSCLMASVRGLAIAEARSTPSKNLFWVFCSRKQSLIRGELHMGFWQWEEARLLPLLDLCRGLCPRGDTSSQIAWSFQIVSKEETCCPRVGTEILAWTAALLIVSVCGWGRIWDAVGWLSPQVCEERLVWAGCEGSSLFWSSQYQQRTNEPTNLDCKSQGGLFSWS